MSADVVSRDTSTGGALLIRPAADQNKKQGGNSALGVQTGILILKSRGRAISLPPTNLDCIYYRTLQTR